ncbi:MAG TPA: hypothetical protein VN085_11365 [Vicinamibacterales bacterium]|nr:hypothetical protein [Vicinamibacterales bacterium]
MRDTLGMSEEALWKLAEQVMGTDLYLTFWLRHNAEFSSEQIAEMLRITRQAVDARLAKAARLLAEEIDKERRVA